MDSGVAFAIGFEGGGQGGGGGRNDLSVERQIGLELLPGGTLFLFGGLERWGRGQPEFRILQPIRG